MASISIMYESPGTNEQGVCKQSRTLTLWTVAIWEPVNIIMTMIMSKMQIVKINLNLPQFTQPDKFAEANDSKLNRTSCLYILE